MQVESLDHLKKLVLSGSKDFFIQSENVVSIKHIELYCDHWHIFGFGLNEEMLDDVGVLNSSIGLALVRGELYLRIPTINRNANWNIIHSRRL